MFLHLDLPCRVREVYLGEPIREGAPKYLYQIGNQPDINLAECYDKVMADRICALYEEERQRLLKAKA